MSKPERSATSCRSDENKVEEEPVPDTVLSDDDLDARIAALGLGQEGGVEDKSTGVRVRANSHTRRVWDGSCGGNRYLKPDSNLETLQGRTRTSNSGRWSECKRRP